MAGLETQRASLPTVTFAEGELVLANGGTSGRLLFLKEGAVEVVKDGVRITRVKEPGAVFGEMSVLLDQPHSADVRAQRLDALNRYLVDVRNQFRAFYGPVAMPDEVIDSIVNKHPRRWRGTGGAQTIFR